MSKRKCMRKRLKHFKKELIWLNVIRNSSLRSDALMRSPGTATKRKNILMNYAHRQTYVSQREETLSARGISESVTWIQRNRLVKEQNRAVKVLFRNLVHVIASLKIEPVRLGVFRIVLHHLFLLPAGQTHP